MPTSRTMPVIFISYAHADEPERPAEGEVQWLSFVEDYLRPAETQGAVEIWTDHLMRGGDDWDPEIKRKLSECDIFVVLVSHNSLSSDYVVRKEIAIIRRRQNKGDDVHFYPLLLTPTPKIALKIVRDKNLRPRDGKPFSDYPFADRLRHMSAAADEIATLAREIAARKKEKARREVERQDKIEKSVGGRAKAQDRQGGLEITVQTELRAATESIVTSTLPPDPKMIGRANWLDQLVEAILRKDRRPIVVPGARGIGKTTLALAAAYDPRITSHFRENRRLFVDLKSVSDADGVLRRLAGCFGLPASGASSEVWAKIAAACAEAPTLVILDSLQTALTKKAEAVEDLIGRLAAIDGIRLILPIRGQRPRFPGAGAFTLQEMEPLSEEDLRELFLRHAGDHFGVDRELDDILGATNGNPLVLETVALNVAGRLTLRGWLDHTVLTHDQISEFAG